VQNSSKCIGRRKFKSHHRTMVIYPVSAHLSSMQAELDSNEERKRTS